MPKQILEKIISKSIKANPDIIGHKLHNNPMAYNRTHCDFEYFDRKGNVYFLECKETKTGRFEFSRFTQLNSLLYYNNFANYMKGYLVLMFRHKPLRESKIYKIPVRLMSAYILRSKKRSINERECDLNFKNFELSFYGKLVYL